MSTYYSTLARSSYFKVRDTDAFKDALAEANVRIVENDGKFALFSTGEHGWDDLPIEGEDGLVPLPEVAASFLADGWVAIFMEVGNEGERYCVGRAVAYDSKGNEVVIDLSDIYAKAEKMGECTEAQY